MAVRRRTQAGSPLVRRPVVEAHFRAQGYYRADPVAPFRAGSTANQRRRVRTVASNRLSPLLVPIAVPSAPAWVSFAGGNGKFRGVLAPPRQLMSSELADSLQFEVQLSSSLSFPAATTLHLQLGNSRTFEVSLATETAYARARCRFPGGTASTWALYASTGTSSGGSGEPPAPPPPDPPPSEGDGGGGGGGLPLP